MIRKSPLATFLVLGTDFLARHAETSPIQHRTAALSASNPPSGWFLVLALYRVCRTRKQWAPLRGP